VAEATPQDAELRQVLAWCQGQWPEVDPGLPFSPYFKRRHAISVMKGCLLWGERVIVPKSMRQQVLQKLHQGHLGRDRTRASAQLYVWYPGLSGREI